MSVRAFACVCVRVTGALPEGLLRFLIPFVFSLFGKGIDGRNRWASCLRPAVDIPGWLFR